MYTLRIENVTSVLVDRIKHLQQLGLINEHGLSLYNDNWEVYFTTSSLEALKSIVSAMDEEKWDKNESL